MENQSNGGSEKISIVCQKEEKTIRFWQENRIFEKSVEIRPRENEFVFYDGPPFATGLPHYGHILSSVTKDLFPRYQTMRGKRVERRWGWDCHGLPIETLVEKKLGISGKKQIEEKGVRLFNDTARSMVLEYVRQWREMVSRIGRWVEFDNSYKTMDTDYVESVWWVLKELWNKKLIYEGRKVLMYCPRCETPVSNAEVSMDNSYKDVTDETVIIKFKIKPGQNFLDKLKIEKPVYVLAWTTTPWTLPANVALAVGGEIKYAIVESKKGEEFYIVASKLIEKVFANEKVKILSDELTGADLNGLEYEPLYEVQKVKNSGKKAWYITTAEFVSTDEGTGVVHTAVIYGEDDFNLGLSLDLPQVPLLDSSGHYNKDAPKFLQNKFYKEAERDIKKDLEDKGLIYSKQQYTHSYPFCWRCDSPLIYNAISAWFINIQKNKRRIIELNEKINWHPKYLQHGRFLNILDSAPDWNISRNRYWATPLPFFKCEKCGKFKCFGSIEELKKSSCNFSEVYPDEQNVDLHRPYIDELEVICECGGKAKRIPEVIDCWVESSSMPFAQFHYPFENKNKFESKYPGDFIGEYISQTRAWFYYMHVIGSLVFDDISFKNVVTTGVILNEKGEKMSKSKQNFPDPWKMINAYGADALRFYIMGSVVMNADNFSFNERELRETYNKVINTLSNILKFFEIYHTQDVKKFSYSSLTILDKYIVSRLEATLVDVTGSLDDYNSVKACRSIKLFIDDLSTWWLRRSRERFRQPGKDRDIAMMTLGYILKKLSFIVAPITPFIAEELYQKVKSDNDPLSVHLADWPKTDEGLSDKSVEGNMEKVKKIVELGHSLRAANYLKVRQPLSSVSFEKFNQNHEDFEGIILDELNIEKRVEVTKMSVPKETVSDKIKVAIDIKLDDRLKEMGDVREIVRLIQDRRRKSGLKPGQKIVVKYKVSSESMREFMIKFSKEICEQSSLESIEEDPSIEDGYEVSISSGDIKILF